MSLFEILLEMPHLMVVIAILLAIYLKNYIEYRRGAYYKVTKNSYLCVLWNKGLYGEYLTYKNLKTLEAHGAKFLFNVYIPKNNGETTEIDVLMISPKGIFVFESKNYGGWIFGGENQKTWYQTLPISRGKCHKEKFYNPIMQNNAHIKHLKQFLGEDISMKSIVVFSDRCTLKRMDLHSRESIVIHRGRVLSTVVSMYTGTLGELLDGNKIKRIYDQLYPCTQVDKTVKAQHVANIHNRRYGTSNENVVFGDISSKGTTRTTHFITDESGTDVLSLPKVQPSQKEKMCPKCGGKLVVRTASKGENKGNQFYGCSNYPKCRYIENMSE